MRAYLGDVLAQFWSARAEGYLQGAEPLCASCWRGLHGWPGTRVPCVPAPPHSPSPHLTGLEDFLAVERRRPACGDPQHIFNNLLFDAANQALAAHRARVRASARACLPAALQRMQSRGACAGSRSSQPPTPASAPPCPLPRRW